MRSTGRVSADKPRVVTTKPSAKPPMFADVVQRVFSATRPNALYVGNILLCLPLADGTNMYLATVIDCFSAHTYWLCDVGDHMRTDLVLEALDHARKGAWESYLGRCSTDDHDSVYT